MERDRVLDADGAFPDEQNLVVDRLGRGQYLVRLVEDGHVPELLESEAIQRAAADLMLQRAANRHMRAD